MADQADPAASDVSEQPEPETIGTEQPTTESKTYGSELIEFAKAEGYSVGDPTLPKAEEKPEPEPEEEVSQPETEPEETEEEEEEQPATKKGEPWPESAKTRVAEEAAKRRRANERADRAEAQIAALQQQMAQVVAPQPTEDDPFKDIGDFAALDRLERSYEKAIDLADENPDGAVDVVVGRNADGTTEKRDFTPEQLLVMRKKADKAIRKFIPERRTYLQQRAIADQEAVRVYPEFADPNSEFTKAAAFLAQRLLTGEAVKDPTILVWIGHAVRGWQESQKRNGKTEPQSPEAKKIVQAARQKVAPTPTRTRSFTERSSSSASLEKAKERLKETGSADDAEEVVAKLLSRGSSSRIEPVE